MEREACLADRELEVLGHLAPVDDGADLERDLGLAAQRLAGTPNRGRNGGKVLFSRGQQVLSLAGALAGEIAIATDDEPLARIIGRRDGRHVALVEQRHLQGSGFRELPDRRRPQRRDPVETRRGDLSVDARLRDHPAVADQYHALEREALFVSLRQVRGSAVENLDRDRAS